MNLDEKLLNPALPVTFFERVPPLPASPRRSSQRSPKSKISGTWLTPSTCRKFTMRRGARTASRSSCRGSSRGRSGAHSSPTRDRRRHQPLRGVRARPRALVPRDGGEARASQRRSGGRRIEPRPLPGPSVLDAAKQVRAAGLGTCLGGITIPSRLHEAERIREKKAAGLNFFTTQILFDSNDIVWLIQRLNGLEARVFLSFAPVSHPRDLEFLRWLGVDIPSDLDRFLLHGEGPGAAPGAKNDAAAAQQTCLERSLDLAHRTLMDVFDNLPPEPPPLGLNIEHINQRNFSAAVQMLDRLGNLYASLVAARARV